MARSADKDNLTKSANANTSVKSSHTSLPSGSSLAAASSLGKSRLVIISRQSLNASGDDLTTALIAFARLTACRVSIFASWKMSETWLT